ncbi:MAG: hypothetical protein JWQ43_937 [Glaciihabitans sp.]|nr:hypothetical protein [Glaciihabitans sp.]
MFPVLGLVAILALAGCAPEDDPAAGTSTPSSSSTSPTPSSSITPSEPPADDTTDVPAIPAQAFDGDCANIAGDADVSSIMGTPMTPVAGRTLANFTNTAQTAVVQGGGITCEWSDGLGDANSGTGTIIDVAVYPADSATPIEVAPTSCLQIGMAESKYECTIGVVESGYWVSGYVRGLATASGSVEEEDVKSDAALRAATVFVERITQNADFSAPDTVLPITGSWNTEGTGEDGWADAGVPALMGDPEGWFYGNEIFDGAPPVANYVVAGASGIASYSWLDNRNMEENSTREPTFEVNVMPGGRWVQNVIEERDGATEIAIDGIELAILAPTLERDLQTLHVFDGANWFQLTDESGPTFRESLYPVAAALVASMNNTI